MRTFSSFTEGEPIREVAMNPVPCPNRKNLLARAGLSFAIALLSGTFTSTLAQAPAPLPAAIVGNEQIFESDIEGQVRTQVYKLQLQEFTVRKKALDEAINNKLLKAEAERLGIKNEDELLKREADSKIKPPTDDEVEENFVQMMFRSGGNITKEHVREQLLQQFITEARDEYFAKLRATAGVKILLSPPRMPVDFDPDRIRGKQDSPITMIEFTDFQCPYCLQSYDVVKQVLKKYDGKVRLSFRDLPLREANGEDSQEAGTADAARCAWEQGKFWEYHDLLFENQDDTGMRVFQEYATSLGLDAAKFNSCMESRKYRDPIQKDLREAISLAIPGTPFFYINGIPLNGFHPMKDFEEIIDAELTRLGK
jgi:protein-disulfide isomerase